MTRGKYLHAQEIVNKLVQAEPQNQAAKDLLADIFEQTWIPAGKSWLSGTATLQLHTNCGQESRKGKPLIQAALT